MSVDEFHAIVERSQSEDDFKDRVVDLAHYHGWLVHHDRPARQKDGSWATHIQGDRGFPDLVLVHRKRKILVFAELKSTKGGIRPDQRTWLDALHAIESISWVQVYLWRPSDWDEISQVLSGEAR